MKPIRLFTLVGASVGAALAAGALFQPEGPAGSTETAADDSVAPAPVSLASAGPGSLIPRGRNPQADAVAAGCDPTLHLDAAPAAMLALSVQAPCEAGKTVTLAHGPLRLTESLGPEGTLTLHLPALAGQAEVALTLADGRTVTGQATVPDFEDHARLVVDWAGPARLDLHAYAGGAGWGEAGHMRQDGPISPQTGFVSALGQNGAAQARVFTWPAGLGPHAAEIALEAELAITPETCGRSFQARVHLIRADGPVLEHRIDMRMPACSAPGGFVLLGDLIPQDALDFAALN